jgi:hypothetical protein
MLGADTYSLVGLTLAASRQNWAKNVWYKLQFYSYLFVCTVSWNNFIWLRQIKSFFYVYSWRAFYSAVFLFSIPEPLKYYKWWEAKYLSMKKVAEKGSNNQEVHWLWNHSRNRQSSKPVSAAHGNTVALALFYRQAY